MLIFFLCVITQIYISFLLSYFFLSHIDERNLKYFGWWNQGLQFLSYSKLLNFSTNVNLKGFVIDLHSIRKNYSYPRLSLLCVCLFFVICWDINFFERMVSTILQFWVKPVSVKFYKKKELVTTLMQSFSLDNF